MIQRLVVRVVLRHWREMLTVGSRRVTLEIEMRRPFLRGPCGLLPVTRRGTRVVAVRASSTPPMPRYMRRVCRRMHTSGYLRGVKTHTTRQDSPRDPLHRLN